MAGSGATRRSIAGETSGTAARSQAPAAPSAARIQKWMADWHQIAPLMT
jgi:hypothetical protein